MKTILSCLTLVLTASTAMAEDDLDKDAGTGTPAKVAPPNDGNLPPSQSDHDVQPPVASPGAQLPDTGIVQQAGVGGMVGYGRAGVLELGGSAGLQMSSEFRSLSINPSIGWFVADNLELSAILGVSNIKAGDESATMWSAVVEPSYHLPFNRSMFGFAGLGIGAAYEQRLGAGLAVAPRIGANFLVGRSGVLTPSLQYQYITHNSMVEDDVTVVALTNALSVNVGYTAMW
ncbi:MAG: hypothetical protein H0T42_10050 [Deltaproteobacteria bacterium]|nr:hypothetical protein [Deltaproteobacteria bacterium]